MLGGEPPFVARSRVAVIARHVSDPAPALTTLRGDVPPGVEALIQRCQGKAPADRYQTAGELRDALDEALSQMRHGAVPTRRLHRPSRRGAWAALGVAAVAIAVFLLLPGPRDAVALSANRVVVFPLADRGGGIPAGADVSIMIGNALVHTDPLRWIDGWELLSLDQRGDPNTLGAAQARSISLGRSARFYVTGGVAIAGDSVTVRLVLHDAEGDSIVRQAAASGTQAETTPVQLGLRAVVQLLPALVDPDRDVDKPVPRHHPSRVS